MAVFVILALAVLAATVGMALVAAVVLHRQVKGLLTAMEDASDRVGRLTDDLASETAVTSLEMEGLQRRLAGRRGHRDATAPRS